MRLHVLPLILGLGLIGCGHSSGPGHGSSTAVTEGTIHGGGGGDPLANEFTRLARLITRAQAAGRVDLGVTNDALDRLVAQIESSLEGRAPRVRFVAGTSLDCFSAPKLGCVDDHSVIRVAREGWRQADAASKIEVVTMELVKSLAATNRYSIAESVSRTLQFQKEVGPIDLLGTDSRLRVSDGPILTENGFRLVNRAMSIAAANRRVPQFDLVLRDNLPNAVSISRFNATSDSEDQCARGTWTRAVAVSAVTSFDPPQRAAAFVVRETFESCPKDKGTPLLTDTIFAPTGWTIGTSARLEASSPTYRTNTLSEAETLESFRAPKSAERLFRPCETAALNEALRRASTDRKFETFVKMPAAGWQERSYRLLTFIGTGLRLDAETKYFITLMVGFDHFQIPYSYLISTRAAGDACRITDVTTGPK